MLVEAEQLRYAYEEGDHRHVVLNGAALSLARGERVALLGSSGSGKSTLLNLIGGIDTPTAGAIRLAGEEITRLKEPALTLFRRRHVGLVYQQFNLIPTLTAAENIRLPLELLETGRTEQREQVRDWLAAVGLSGRGGDFPDQLSGGEQQRVAIARALIHRPGLILADEPTGSLDARTGRQVLELLFDIAARNGQTLLIVTHSRAVAERADRLLVLEDGVVRGGDRAEAW